MSLNGGFTRRLLYLKEHGLMPNRTVHAGLSHGNRVAVVTAANGGHVIEQTDGLITTEPNVGLAMTAADCLLVYVYSSRAPAIGLVHAGRRGLAAGILVNTIRLFRRLGIRPGALEVNISPSICPAHYAVQPQDAAPFKAWPEVVTRVGDYDQLDLRRVAWRQLHDSGVPEEAINVDPRCTFEERELFSYRRDHPTESQLQVGYMMYRQ